MPKTLSCFKAYDVRGEIDLNFDSDVCYRIARAFAKVLKPQSVVLGQDIRKTSSIFADSVAEGLLSEGVNVLDIGLAGTEEMYWATSYFKAGGGIEITASHNPINFNGLKMVKSESRPLENIDDFLKIKELAECNNFSQKKLQGKRLNKFSESKAAYVDKVLEFVDPIYFPKIKIVVNSGHGAVGPTFDLIQEKLGKLTKNLDFVKIDHSPDSNFPNGIPNPLLKENHLRNKQLVIKNNADLAIAFDGDFDRCFFFDENGEFISGEYIVGLLAEIFLLKEPNSKIIHDSRVIWNVEDIVKNNAGESILSVTGHSFFKKAMRDNNAIYGGEISAHHYFRNFAYCDSGMIPWLLILELMGRTGKKLSEIVGERKRNFPSSGEINFTVADPKSAIEKVFKYYCTQNLSHNHFDGLSMEFKDWRLNLRKSNTEPLIRLNIESFKNSNLINQHIKKISSILIS